MTFDDLFDLLSTDFGDVWQRAVEVFFDPASDLQLAILVYAIVSLVVIIALVAVMLFLSAADDEEVVETAPTDDEYFVLDDEPVAEGEPQVVPVQPSASRTRNLALNAVLGVVAAGLVWFALGAATTQQATCTGCHTETPHNVTVPDTTWLAGDAHEQLGCVDCHESASAVGRYGLATVSRTAHVLTGFGLMSSGEYGWTSSQSCLNCHGAVASTTIENEVRAIRVSHAEPIAAGAACIDCHGLVDGVVSREIGGMTRCVVCHDGETAESECGYCHTQDVSVAASQPSPPRADTAKRIIETPDCGGCHNLEATCDPCHGGVRLPHSPEFVAGGHARPAVRDYWYGSGTTCQQCHTATRRPCGTCHQGQFWSHGKSWAANHRQANPNNNNCDACHGQTVGKRTDRNFCIDVCHTDREDWRTAR